MTVKDEIVELIAVLEGYNPAIAIKHPKIWDIQKESAEKAATQILHLISARLPEKYVAEEMAVRDMRGNLIGTIQHLAHEKQGWNAAIDQVSAILKGSK